MADDRKAAARREFEAQYGIPPDRFCGLSAAEMSRAIVCWRCSFELIGLLRWRWGSADGREMRAHPAPPRAACATAR